jgi:hypothetical protein
MSREVVNQRPTRKTLVTGESLPALQTSSRPIPLGRDEEGKPDSQVRAFAVLARNRSDSSVYIREGPSDDENEVATGESFQIWEPNGINEVQVRGENGGERVEFRTLEAHNDFSITDKIDAFTRALSHFFGTSKRSTTIDGDVSIGEISDTVDIGTVIGDISVGSLPAVDIGTINDGISVDNGTISVDSIPDLTISEFTAGAIDANVNGNVVVDDISTASASFDGDITGQTDFDLSAAVREGRTKVTSVADSGLVEGKDIGGGLTSTASYHFDLYEPASYDGTLERVEFRVYDYGDADTVGFRLRIDYDSTGSYDIVTPRATAYGRIAEKQGNRTVEVPRYYPESEVVIVYEPSTPIRFTEGDSVAIEIGAFGNRYIDSTTTYDAELEVITTEIQKT